MKAFLVAMTHGQTHSAVTHFPVLKFIDMTILRIFKLHCFHIYDSIEETSYKYCSYAPKN